MKSCSFRVRQHGKLYAGGKGKWEGPRCDTVNFPTSPRGLARAQEYALDCLTARYEPKHSAFTRNVVAIDLTCPGSSMIMARCFGDPDLFPWDYSYKQRGYGCELTWKAEGGKGRFAGRKKRRVRKK